MTLEEHVRLLSQQLSDQGKIVEAGWVAYRLLVLPPNVSRVQDEETRKAFFAGAQHLFGSITTMLEGGEEATEGDLRRMTQISNELDAFLRTLKS